LRRVSAIAVLFSHRQKLLERDTERLFVIVQAAQTRAGSPSMALLSKQARAAAVIIATR
jgi:hypothetical protein